jgi:hypothetical protein
MARYAVTIFLSAFLLFQVQPLVGKFILPWFGGTPAVWTTCMLFFQVLLLGGYSYAHLLTSTLKIGQQRGLHLTLLLASLVFLPIVPSEAWKPIGAQMPVTDILLLLLATIGLPYFLLSSTGPLLQESFRRETGRIPYRLYSLSNIGSLLALLTYPFVFEPQLTRRTQIYAWSVGYLVFFACSAWCAWRFVPLAPPSDARGNAAKLTPKDEADKPRRGQILLWLALAACGSTMLLATTNQLCQEVSSVPFLWVLPLAIYLVTFILCFDHERWYYRNGFLFLLILVIVLAGITLDLGRALGLRNQLGSYLLTLFVCCMVCHGELASAKPAPRHATLFYLIVSAGGAVGGVLVAIVAPFVFPGYWEYQLGLMATVVLALVATFGPTAARSAISQRRLVMGGIVAVGTGLAIVLILHFSSEPIGSEQSLASSRNFYGVLRVNRSAGLDHTGPRNELMHGQTQQGFQFLDADKLRWPTSYYGGASGVGLALRHHPRRHAADAEQRTLRIGIVGLGCGTLAAYGQKGDTIRFYELNPEVQRLAAEYFTYCKDSEATIDVVLGDARISLERELADEHAPKFDVLVVDAFSSDAIPMHLLTKECVELYRCRLEPDGLLCVHISNSFLDLSGVVYGIAEAVGSRCEFVESEGDPALGTDMATWAIVTANEPFLQTPEVRRALTPRNPSQPPPVVWTDDYSSLWQVLRP